MSGAAIGIGLGRTKALILSNELEEASTTGPEFSAAATEARLRRFVIAHGLSPPRDRGRARSRDARCGPRGNRGGAEQGAFGR